MAENQKVRKWIELGKKRIQQILFTHIVANPRTLEQKISDGGPFNQRTEPLYLTQARNELEQEGIIDSLKRAGVKWYFLVKTPTDKVKERLQELTPIYKRISAHNLLMRLGQALEIAIYRGLCNQTTLTHYGGFPNLDKHDDSRLYKKEEPPVLISGKEAGGRFDFILSTPNVKCAGVEAKNVRNWIYPKSVIVKKLLAKCCAVDAVPVLIARRISYVAFTEVFEPCGVVVHQTFNQRYPGSENDLAKKASHKDLLGYHDIRIGNEVDSRLEKFININLPQVLTQAAAKFQAHKDILEAYATEEISYLDFHVELRKRSGIYE